VFDGEKPPKVTREKMRNGLKPTILSIQMSMESQLNALEKEEK
jgi:hypothetical protein